MLSSLSIPIHTRERGKYRKYILNLYDLMATLASMFQKTLIISREDNSQQSRRGKQMSNFSALPKQVISNSGKVGNKVLLKILKS